MSDESVNFSVIGPSISTMNEHTPHQGPGMYSPGAKGPWDVKNRKVKCVCQVFENLNILNQKFFIVKKKNNYIQKDQISKVHQGFWRFLVWPSQTPYLNPIETFG